MLKKPLLPHSICMTTKYFRDRFTELTLLESLSWSDHINTAPEELLSALFYHTIPVHPEPPCSRYHLRTCLTSTFIQPMAGVTAVKKVQ
ncbi:hypothetical protein BC936DRAFT_147610 [Jimgerdemannia flammicorona]|uniref:Uncharacterized protein n=1 Tax=Jimgerdemannia flammicorona TaxID=994334 RepID=A0A433D4Z6_9FUNG|nr:hypothetical protein BC936DRAFT_147610 [Jimgerdemannia flammicorona]